MIDELSKKKQKKIVVLDYSKMPEHIFEKHLKDFVDSVNNIGASLELLESSINLIKD